MNVHEPEIEEWSDEAVRKRHKRVNVPQSKSAMPLFSKNRLHLVEVDAFMNPLEVFIDQVKRDAIWVNEAGEAVMDLPRQGVEDLVKQGIAPPAALPSFAIMFETYFQVVTYCLDTEAMQRAHDQISLFRSTILSKLESDTLIESKDIIYAEDLLRNMKTVFISVPREKILKVMNEIKLAISSSTDESFKMEDLRAWLLKEIA